MTLAQSQPTGEPSAERNVRIGIWTIVARQRNDVGFELRSLLNEEIEDRAAATTGRPADEVLVMEFLPGFGHPEDIADRYLASEAAVIRAGDAPRLAWLALGGVLLQWALTLSAALLSTAAEAPSWHVVAFLEVGCLLVAWHPDFLRHDRSEAGPTPP